MHSSGYATREEYHAAFNSCPDAFIWKDEDGWKVVIGDFATPSGWAQKSFRLRRDAIAYAREAYPTLYRGVAR